MPFQTDFLNAHERHWNDAEFLFTQKRLPNADHLYGFATECGLKYLMTLNGMPVQKNGSPEKSEDKVHVNRIWDRCKAYSNGKVHIELPVGDSPFSDWDVSDRYAHSSNFDLTYVEKHQNAAKVIFNLVQKAQQEFC